MSKTDKGKKGTGLDVEKLMNDNRFGQMFTDSDFKIDKTSDAYKLMKPQESKKGRVEDIDSINGDESEVENTNKDKGQNLNKLFSGQVDDSDNENDEDKDNDFMSKMNQK